MRLSCRAYISASRFLEDFDAELGGCLIAEVRIPDLSGLQLQQHLRARECPMPVIFLTAHATVSLVVRAMQQGAVDFIEKPPEEDRLWEAVQTALRLDARRRAHLKERRGFQQKLDQLTDQENQVFRMMIEDVPTRAMAEQLKLSPRTIEARRASIRQKLDVSTPLELMRMAIRVFDDEHATLTPKRHAATDPRFTAIGKPASWTANL
jgi:FixJ family two-component response regulator